VRRGCVGWAGRWWSCGEDFWWVAGGDGGWRRPFGFRSLVESAYFRGRDQDGKGGGESKERDVVSSPLRELVGGDGGRGSGGVVEEGGGARRVIVGGKVACAGVGRHG
jgi:hypothetical protein